MKQKVIERIKAWKSFYASQVDGIDENSSWVDILLKLSLSFEDSIILGRKAIIACDAFSFEESLYLRNLPYYNDVKELMAAMPNNNFGDYFASKLPTGDDIYFVRYPKLGEVHNGDNLFEVPIVVATIVNHKPVDFDAEVYVWCNLNLVTGWTCKHLIIRYANERPQDYVEPSTPSF